jgi:Resolvase, N terminal domain
MSSIICNRNGVIEVSLGSSKPARWRRPLEAYPQLSRRLGSDAPTAKPFSPTTVCATGADHEEARNPFAAISRGVVRSADRPGGDHPALHILLRRHGADSATTPRRNAGAKFRSLTEAIDTSGPAGRMLMQMLGSFAEFEREMIRERAVSALLTTRFEFAVDEQR